MEALLINDKTLAVPLNMLLADLHRSVTLADVPVPIINQFISYILNLFISQIDL